MRRYRRGATTIEFSLILLVFLAFLFAVLEFSRMLFTWSAATEATRAGARYAVVCDDTFSQSAVLARMQQLLPQIASVSVQWSPPNCTPSTCASVTVGITNLNYKWIAPIPSATAAAIPMPTFSTTTTREVMRQDPHSNAICS